jgi:hypothetical protein
LAIRQIENKKSKKKYHVGEPLVISKEEIYKSAQIPPKSWGFQKTFPQNVAIFLKSFHKVPLTMWLGIYFFKNGKSTSFLKIYLKYGCIFIFKKLHVYLHNHVVHLNSIVNLQIDNFINCYQCPRKGLPHKI